VEVGGRGLERGRGDDIPPSCTVVLRGLSFSTNEESELLAHSTTITTRSVAATATANNYFPAAFLPPNEHPCSGRCFVVGCALPANL
jgi:hypothetical protein